MCHGVNTFGPSAVIATVNSKCAAGEPSCEKIAQPSPPTRTAARPAVIIGSTDVEDMIAGNAPGDTTVTVKATGATKVVRFHIVP